MEVELLNTHTNQPAPGMILLANKQDMPPKRAGWKFSWKKLYGIEGASYYKLCLSAQLNEIQGLMMLSLMNQELLHLNNLEVAPHNYGRQGEYDYVAGALLAYGCFLSFELCKGNYNGFLSFDSKTKLIPLYQNKYGAVHIMGQKMYLDPEGGRRLMKQYLNRSFNE